MLLYVIIQYNPNLDGLDFMFRTMRFGMWRISRTFEKNLLTLWNQPDVRHKMLIPKHHLLPRSVVQLANPIRTIPILHPLFIQRKHYRIGYHIAVLLVLHNYYHISWTIIVVVSSIWYSTTIDLLFFWFAGRPSREWLIWCAIKSMNCVTPFQPWKCGSNLMCPKLKMVIILVFLYRYVFYTHIIRMKRP